MSSESQLERPTDNAAFYEHVFDEGHPFIVPSYEGCVSLIPSEWGLGDSDFPEKWMFTVTGDLATIIGAQPHGAMHGKFPYGVLESEVEAYGTWNRGLPEIIEPLQNTMDFLINQHFFNVRAALNNQFILDPSRISTRGAEDGGPGFVYRLRPEAYGQDIRQFFHQIPIADVTAGHVNDMNTMIGIGERVTGINELDHGRLERGREEDGDRGPDGHRIRRESVEDYGGIYVVDWILRSRAADGADESAVFHGGEEV